MGNEYYGRNDYRDYLAHYGVKGMKWKKGRKTPTYEELLAIRRARIRARMNRAIVEDNKNKVKAERLSKKAADGKAIASGKWARKYDKHIAVTSGRRVESNVRSFDPNKSYVVSTDSRGVITGRPVKKGKRIKNKLKSATRKSIRKAAKSAYTSRARSIINAMKAQQRSATNMNINASNEASTF